MYWYYQAQTSMQSSAFHPSSYARMPSVSVGAGIAVTTPIQMCRPCEGLSTSSSKIMAAECTSFQVSTFSSCSTSLLVPPSLTTENYSAPSTSCTVSLSFSLSCHSLAFDQTHLLPRVTKVTLQPYISLQHFPVLFSLSLFFFPYV